jgi:starch synthase
MTDERLHVAFVTPEMYPYVKTGGLADVAAALPKALARLGHRVTVFLPRYGCIPSPPGELVGTVHVPVDGVNRSAGFYLSSPGRGVHVVFVEHAPFFDRPQLYGGGSQDYGDNALRFAFLARAALEYSRSRAERPSVLHAHDWQAGLVPAYLKAFYPEDATLSGVPCVFTIHSMAYQGLFDAGILDTLGLPRHLYAPEALEFHGRVSYLKAGIQLAEVVTTVSPQYARDIQGPEAGCGFEGVMRARAADLRGILNGVDYEEWEPRIDRHIARRFSRDLSGKQECKNELLRAFSLPREPALPVVAVSSRLVSHKGIDLIVEAREAIISRGLRLIVMGEGDGPLADAVRALPAEAPDRVAVRIGYDVPAAHVLLAGADMVLVPSRFEPCGLTQMYALRYGTVPIVRATGGLADTVEEAVPGAWEGTGFRFDEASAEAMLGALDRALSVYADQEAWRRIMRNGMARDFSWERSARLYVEAYRHAMKSVQ